MTPSGAWLIILRMLLVLIGGPGADTLDGGEDSKEKNVATAVDIIPALDPIDGDTDDPGESAQRMAKEDTASYAGSKMGVTVNLASGRGTGGDAEGDTLVNIEQVMGSGNDDTFLASDRQKTTSMAAATRRRRGGMATPCPTSYRRRRRHPDICLLLTPTLASIPDIAQGYARSGQLRYRRQA